MKSICLLGFILLSSYGINSQQTNEFGKGFDVGFKKGYCYSSPLGCLPPITPITPLPNSNEKLTSFEDGYNKGFLIGKGLSDCDALANGKGNLTTGYTEPIRPFKPGQYIDPVDLKLMALVLKYKQDLFDARADWIQKRLTDLSSINTALFQKTNKQHYTEVSERINFIVVSLNQGVDFTNDGLFSYYASSLSTVQTFLYSKLRK
jgi:hypothetical protein